MKNNCGTKTLRKKLLVLCEGQTEYNYYDHYRKNQSLSFSFKPVDVAGGGYLKMLTELKKTSPQGVMARFVLLDMDRYFNHVEEQQVLTNIFNYISAQNKNGNPVFLILSNPDFDRFVLLHDNNFTGNINAFLPNVGYHNINELKADQDIYEKFNNQKTGRSVQNALRRLCSLKPPVENQFSYTKKSFTFSNTLIVNNNFFVNKTSNIIDLYNVVKKIEE